MASTKNLYGGALKIDSKVWKLIRAHMAVIVAEDGSELEHMALKRREKIAGKMTQKDRGDLLLFTHGIARIATADRD